MDGRPSVFLTNSRFLKRQQSGKSSFEPGSQRQQLVLVFLKTTPTAFLLLTQLTQQTHRVVFVYHRYLHLMYKAGPEGDVLELKPDNGLCELNKE
ncbi:uncharacterized protein V6R79_003829 [Siganus canaliculatus]